MRQKAGGRVKDRHFDDTEPRRSC